ncbi:Ger(x)C family spore germination protein [Paenibacillus cremeus]|uniref:Ger(X)C family spore germination protein n=1 Tax=Paenibacillus cremeus TaxID=2163881 RepID=A0A559K6R1_9BACL|nr:Ger(x)C family spore germination protein [Paenibacillus cremeus]TVY07811.1 Ger(x)C family spore germination protein [Paenibacillus cremeus]
MKLPYLRLGRQLIGIAALSALVLLSGCWDRVEVNDLALITGAAVDKEDEHHLKLTVQLFLPKTAEGGQMDGVQAGGAGGAQSLVRSAIGSNIADATSKLQERLSRKLFWGHSEVFLISEQMAKDGIQDDIDYLMRSSEPRERAYLFVTKKDARDVLSYESSLERNTSEALRELAKSQIELQVTLKKLAEMLTSEAGAQVLPVVELLPPGPTSDSKRTIGFISGSAVFKHGKLVGEVNDSVSRGILWLRNEIKKAIVTVEVEGYEGNISLTLLRSQTQLIPHYVQGKWTMEVLIDTVDDVLQNTTTLNLAADPKAIAMVEKKMNEAIKLRVQSALQNIQQKMKADVFDFAGTFHRSYPKPWKTAKSEWDELYPSIPVTVKVNAIILRPGLTNMKPPEQSSQESPP